MKKICFTIDDVLRAKTVQIAKMYKKYIDKEFDADSFAPEDKNSYWEELGFESQKEYNTYMYVDYPFEIFGEANATSRMVDKNFNNWMIAINNDEELNEQIDIMFANPFEFNASIGNTMFFLAKMATRVRDFYFPKDSSTIWDRCDVLVTAEPKLLNEKPEGKVSVKIATPYNKDCEADYTFDSLQSLIDDNNFLKKIVGKDDTAA